MPKLQERLLLGEKLVGFMMKMMRMNKKRTCNSELNYLEKRTIVMIDHLYLNTNFIDLIDLLTTIYKLYYYYSLYFC